MKRLFIGLTLVIFSLTFYLLWNSDNSISGSDKNGDGVRDDVENFIDSKYSTSEKTRASAKQFAKALQNSILNPELGKFLKENPDSPKNEINRAVTCITKIVGFSDVTKDVEAAVINTVARNEAYIKFNANLSGGVYPTWDEEKNGAPCLFNSDAMKD